MKKKFEKMLYESKYPCNPGLSVKEIERCMKKGGICKKAVVELMQAAYDLGVDAERSAE